MRGPSKPKHVRDIFEAPGPVLSVLTTWPGARPGTYRALVVIPPGVSAWVPMPIRRATGVRRYWADLPEDVREHIRERLTA